MGLFSKRSNSSSHKYVEWTCDFCGVNLNSQRGFSTRKGVWKCKKCGEKNDVSDNNIVPDDFIGEWKRFEKEDGSAHVLRFTKTKEVHDFIDSFGDKEGSVYIDRKKR